MDLPKVCHILRAWITPYFFTVRRDEKLYLEYTEKQKQRAIPRLLCLGLIFQTFTIVIPGETDLVFAYSLSLTACALNLILIGLYFLLKHKRTLICHVTWLVLWAQILISAVRRQGDAYNELLGWACLLQYLTFATLPFSGPTLLLYSIISALAYLWVQLKNASMFETREPEDLLHQGYSNISLLLCAGLLGITAFVIYESQHRRSFVDTKRSLRDKLTIEQQSKEQERLLLSVLPEHVAVQMRKDLGLIDTQFKKIYMSRHENVSILYADIVGFTAISSTYSAQDLVAILNELFARFDRLSEKYQQLRIKILGDCYYCISGAPVERPDHAVLCVHMGLSMVKAIKYVQQTTKSPVDMRVGIHTGAILAGVLGQRQWQFDVYSRDVELANKMESSGMAGRVHVSEVTLGYLNDEFEVEPAYGEKREEMLRQAGIKTYFIVKVLKPFYGDEKSGEGADEERGDTFSDLRDDDEDSVLSEKGEMKDSEEILIHNMLEEELRNRDDDKELKATGWCLSFDMSGEVQYMKRSDPSPLTVIAPPLVMTIPILMLSFLVMPDGYEVHNSYIFYILFSTLTTFVFYASYRWQLMKKQYDPEHRSNYSHINLIIFVSATVYPLIFCSQLDRALEDGLNEDAIQHSGARVCRHPSYYYHMSSLALCAVMLVSPVSHLRRLLTLLVICFLYLGPSLLDPLVNWPRPSVEHYPYTHLENGTLAYEVDSIFCIREMHRYRHIFMVYLMAACVAIFDRYLEALRRARHLRTERMRVQAEQAADLRRRNQALVYNVLPPHVARHFMGAHRNHRDLYSQSYAEVGVLFASMPNFTEFYSEETVNNQGLECLRFLNEVISDFDLLLEESKFRDIIKIKTISSTYMAASGLNPKKDLKDADTTVLRWNHLMCLVEFALELQRVLAAINEQSFNHFVLRLGVNHGPITAGVIGAKKPHYDIWGNTVNVASRMESTGKAGCIQVTEETCHILEEFGYYFEQRGLVAVKGKGQLMTYYLQGRNLKPTEPTQHTDGPLAVENGDVKIFINGGQETEHDDPEPVADIPLLPKGL